MIALHLFTFQPIRKQICVHLCLRVPECQTFSFQHAWPFIQELLWHVYFSATSSPVCGREEASDKVFNWAEIASIWWIETRPAIGEWIQTRKSRLLRALISKTFFYYLIVRRKLVYLVKSNSTNNNNVLIHDIYDFRMAAILPSQKLSKLLKQYSGLWIFFSGIRVTENIFLIPPSCS